MQNNYLLKTREGQLVVVKEYSNEYRDKVIEFLIEVAIKEFGFEEWNDYFNKAEFLETNILNENFWIAVNNSDNIVGTIGIINDKISNTAKLHSLYIKKEYRKNGIAKVLYNYALSFAKEVRIQRRNITYI